MSISQAQHAALISRVTRMAEELQQMMDILLPDLPEGVSCPHVRVEHEETMDDEPQPYKCLDCGAEQLTPFHTE